MKKIVALVAFVTIVIIGYVVAGPFITIHNLKSGIEYQDPEMISEQVDFSTLRTNLKEQFNAFFVKQTASDLKDNPFAALGMVFASKLIDGMIDTLVTPTSLSNLMEGKKSQRPQDKAGMQEASNKKKEPFKDARYTYDSLSKFSAWIKNDQGKEIRFVFTRNNLSWKLSNIWFPIDMLEGNRNDPARNQSNIKGAKDYIILQNIRQRVINNYMLGNIRIVEGTAVNQADFSISNIMVKGEILDAYGGVLSEQVSYAGNVLTDAELTNLSEEEIIKRLYLPEGQKNSNKKVITNGLIPFMIVFTKEPSGSFKKTVHVFGAEQLL